MKHAYRTALASALMTSFAGQATAAEIKIEEFSGLTRVTIPIQPDEVWDKRTEAGLHTFFVDRNRQDLIAISPEPESRIATFLLWSGANESGFDLSVNCDCTVSTFSATGQSLVIDIAEKSIAAPAQQTIALPAPPLAPPMQIIPEPATHVTRAPKRTLPSPSVEPESRPGILRSPTWQAPDEALRLAQVLVATPVPRVRPEKTTPISDAEQIDQIRGAVLEQFSTAAEDGVITLQSGSAMSNRNQPPPLNAACPDEGELDLARLSDAEGFRAPLGKLRAAVFDDMKQISESNVRALARHYIAYGLGSEAHGIIESFDLAGVSARLISEMAMALDGTANDVAGASLLRPDCGPRAAVWRAALLAKGGNSDFIEALGVSNGALYELPGPLQRVLGGRIILALIDTGDFDTAQRIWRALEVAKGPITPEMMLAKAYLPQADGTKAKPLTGLLDLADANSVIALEAALRAADLVIKTDSYDAPDRLMAALEDMAFRYRETAQAKDIALAMARIDAHFGNLTGSLARLKEKAKVYPRDADTWLSVRRELILSTAMRADPKARPADFEVLLNEINEFGNAETAVPARFALGRSLIAAGGSHLVRQIMPADLLRSSLEARQIMAEAELMLGQTRNVAILLRGQKDETSLELLGRAQALKGLIVADEAGSKFAPVAQPDTLPPLAGARDLIDAADTDAQIMKEMLVDG